VLTSPDASKPIVALTLRKIQSAQLGRIHPALTLRATNRLGEAEPLMRRALAIDEASLGPEHPNVARDLNNLAELLRVNAG